MSFDITQYKLKHIVSVNKDLLGEKSITIEIDNGTYEFKAENIGSEIIEFVKYFKYSEINNSLTPIEKKLKDYTYGKSYNELSEHEVYDIRFSKFKLSIYGEEHELKDEILNIYTPLIENNENYQKKLNEMKEKYDAEQAEREKIREEVRKEQEEKERKRKELEEMLNSNKPKNNNRPFKMY